MGSQVGLLFEKEVYAIQGAVFEVYREMGCGFIEAVYRECLIRELRSRGIPSVVEPELELAYKKQRLDQTFRPDLICFDLILLELKAVKSITPEHQAQLINYLKISGRRLGLLVNYGHHPKVEIQRFAH